MANLNLNKVILGGRLTADPELKSTSSGVSVMTFSVAVGRKYAAKPENGAPAQPQADFINCVAWRQQAEFISKYFHKGSGICVVGRIQTRSYTDTMTGGKRYVTEVVVDEVNFVDSKNDAKVGTPAEAPAGQVPQFEVLSDEEELPF